MTSVDASKISRSPLRNGVAGVKKGGAGGRGTWGVPGDELRETSLSHDDPVYDPDEEPFTLDAVRPKLTGPQFKSLTDAVLREFIDGTVGVQEAGSRRAAMNAPLYHFYAVRKLLRLGLPDQQQSVADLLKYMCSPAIEILSKDQLQRGMSDAILTMREWELDAPGFSGALKNLVELLVDSDCLHSSFLDDQVCMLEKRPALKIRILDALEEFFVSFDFDEFIKVVTEVGCPAFHGQVVKYIFRSAIEKPPEKIEQGAQLLARVSGPKEPISMLEFMQGMEMLLSEAEDILLDNPDCKEIISQLVARTVVDECVPPSLLEHVFAVTDGDMGHEILKIASDILQHPGAAERAHAMWTTSSQ